MVLSNCPHQLLNLLFFWLVLVPGQGFLLVLELPLDLKEPFCSLYSLSFMFVFPQMPIFFYKLVLFFAVPVSLVLNCTQSAAMSQLKHNPLKSVHKGKNAAI